MILALGKLESSVIISACEIYMDLVKDFDHYSDCDFKSSCIELFKLYESAEIKNLKALAELCDRVFINPNQAAFIRKASQIGEVMVSYD